MTRQDLFAFAQETLREAALIASSPVHFINGDEVDPRCATDAAACQMKAEKLAEAFDDIEESCLGRKCRALAQKLSALAADLRKFRKDESRPMTPYRASEYPVQQVPGILADSKMIEKRVNAWFRTT